MNKKFYRNSDDVNFGGVCSGIAEYFGVDVVLVRILTVAMWFFSDIPVLFIYFIIWMVAPQDSKSRLDSIKKEESNIFEAEVKEKGE